MKPMHAEFKRVSRCPCCQSKYSYKGARKTNVGKTATRMRVKDAIRKEVRES